MLLELQIGLEQIAFDTNVNFSTWATVIKERMCGRDPLQEADLRIAADILVEMVHSFVFLLSFFIHIGTGGRAGRQPVQFLASRPVPGLQHQRLQPKCVASPSLRFCHRDEHIFERATFTQLDLLIGRTLRQN